MYEEAAEFLAKLLFSTCDVLAKRTAPRAQRLRASIDTFYAYNQYLNS